MSISQTKQIQVSTSSHFAAHQHAILEPLSFLQHTHSGKPSPLEAPVPASAPSNRTISRFQVPESSDLVLDFPLSTVRKNSIRSHHHPHSQLPPLQSVTMSSDDQNNNNNAPNTNNDVNGPNDMSRNRRASVSSTAFTNLFQRSNSTSAGTPALPGPIATAMNDHRRRLSVSTIGLSGTSPTTMATPFGLRRGSLSTNGSESIDESAIDEDEVGAPNSRTAPATPFTRRMSFGTQAMRNMRTGRGTSPGTNGMATTIPSATVGHPRRSSVCGLSSSTAASGDSVPDQAVPKSHSPAQQGQTTFPKTAIDALSASARPTDQGFNWSEQFRSRAESTVTGSRPQFSFGSSVGTSPPRPGGVGPQHDRAKSISEMPAPPAQTPQARSEPRKPDAFQERILKGDFYMD